MKIDAKAVQKLRESSGAGMMDAKAALEEAGGDFDKALTILRKKGQATSAKRADKEAKAGLVEGYVHMNRVGALVELNCETDFVARTDDFKAFAKELTMQIAAAAPLYLDVADVPKAAIDKEKEVYAEEVKGKPADIADKILAGKLDKFYAEVCLLKQPTIQDNAVSVEEKLSELVAKLGEKIVISRFARFELGSK